MNCPNCNEPTNISVERVEDMREATCNVCGYFWLIDDDGAIWIPDTAARDDDGDGDESAVTPAPWVVFWSNEEQRHCIRRGTDAPPGNAGYVPVGEFEEHAYAVEFVDRRLSVRRLAISSEDMPARDEGQVAP